jgi:hypothetical protein
VSAPFSDVSEPPEMPEFSSLYLSLRCQLVSCANADWKNLTVMKLLLDVDVVIVGNAASRLHLETALAKP